MGKKEQNISIYLRKDTYEVLKRLSDITKQPISGIIAHVLQEEQCLNMLKNLCVVFEDLIKKGGETSLHGREE